MADHTTEWLGAYLDGELQGELRQQVENHLSTCTTCREELESLQSLSDLLHEIPAAVDILPASRLVPQVLLCLPSRPQPLRNRILLTGWSLVPAVLLAALVFVQTVWVVSGLTLLAGQTGLFDGIFSWLSPAATQGSLSTGIASFLNIIPGHSGQFLIVFLNGGEWLNNSLLIPLSIQVSLMLILASWLASWFARRTAILDKAGQR